MNDVKYNLQLWEKRDNRYTHVNTIIYAVPYSLCVGMKKKLQAYKKWFQFYKIVKNV